MKKEGIKIIINKWLLVLFFLFILGTVHWYAFINFGGPTLNYWDSKIDYPMYDTIKQSVKEFKIPYHVGMYDVPMVQYGDSIYESRVGPYGIRWFANGLSFASPHLVLLSFFDVPTMMTLNIIIHFSIGFWGILLWIKKLNLSIPSSIFLILIWSFNGYVVSDMGVGHIHSRTAYLFVPMFFWLIYQFIQREDMHWRDNVRNVILFSFLIFFMKLNGNPQPVYQFLLVGSVIILFYPRQWLWYAGAVVLSMLLMTFYIVPTAMFSLYMEQVYGGTRVMQAGYGGTYGDIVMPIDIDHMKMGLEKISYHVFNIFHHVWSSLTVSFNAGYKGQWIFNIYVSLYGFILLCCCSAAFLIQNYKTKAPFNVRIFFVFCIISILSLSVFFMEIHKLIVKYIVDYPLVDKLPSYLAIYPLSLVFLIAALGFDYFFQIFPSKIRELIKYISIIILFYFLLSHSFEWFIISTELHADLVAERQDDRFFFKTSILDIPGDKKYIRIVNISYLISFITALILLFVLFLIRTKKHQTNKYWKNVTY